MSWLTAYIGSSPSLSQISPSSGTHRYPEVYRTMNATSSGVAFSAAKIRSPSFSRSSSSMTTTAFPAAISATARSTVSSLVICATLPVSAPEPRNGLKHN